MLRLMRVTALAWLILVLIGPAGAQDTTGAATSRKRLQQKITVEWKDVITKTIFEDIRGEMDPPVTFKIDTVSGMSLNTKLTFSAKNKTVEEILTEMSDKFEFGWIIKSDIKDKYDGYVILRKAKEKERGYEAGKEPKKKAGVEAMEGALPYLARNTVNEAKWNRVVQGGIRWLMAIQEMKNEE